MGRIYLSIFCLALSLCAILEDCANYNTSNERTNERTINHHQHLLHISENAEDPSYCIVSESFKCISVQVLYCVTHFRHLILQQGPPFEMKITTLACAAVAASLFISSDAFIPSSAIRYAFLIYVIIFSLLSLSLSL